MGPLAFVKVEGAGNDYVLVDGFRQVVEDPAGLARALSDRHRGVGSDGLLLVGPAPDVDARMQIFNADGSEGRMCGNGLRCVVEWLARTGRASGGDVVVATAAGPRRGRRLAPGRVEVDMGVPDFRPAAVPVTATAEGDDPPCVPLPPGLEADPDRGLCVSVGNPHVVVRVADPGRVDLARAGSALQRSPLLPEGANVHFIRLTASDAVSARVWERGSGGTRSCGSGAVAIAAVARAMAWTRGDRTRVTMPGGELEVHWDGAGGARLVGPARLVYRGEWPRA